MIKLEKLKELLLAEDLLSEDTFDIDDMELILDNREIDVFDSEWMRNYNIIKQEEGLNNQEIKNLIKSIREISYKITYNETQSSDLAGYISDDFGLIAEALVLNYNDDWLNALAKEYVEDRIPNGNLKLLKGELSQIILNS
ncbi:hypothetical protein [Clostridium sp. DJ247]|uniref:hypothetical protein n=1 Tax=Clostridium sp. DJ247 TaxID=2726188 RepID=UPI0016264A87|nr:hypothetical protein [Clostridium sp. DJ247]MBC2582743.1 hypothetical protein [Clostridium sp. DJ247]